MKRKSEELIPRKSVSTNKFLHFAIALLACLIIFIPFQVPIIFGNIPRYNYEVFFHYIASLPLLLGVILGFIIGIVFRRLWITAISSLVGTYVFVVMFGIFMIVATAGHWFNPFVPIFWEFRDDFSFDDFALPDISLEDCKVAYSIPPTQTPTPTATALPTALPKPDISQIHGSEKIVFTSLRSGHSEIYIMNPDGSEIQQITDNDWGSFNPNFSPDGSKLVFDSKPDEDNEIFIMDIDGSNIQQLTNNDWSDTNPMWSPDGSKIAYVSDRDGDNEINVMNADGSDVQQLTVNEHSDLNPSWSPDGNQIVYTSQHGSGFNWDIIIMDADGNNAYQLNETVQYHGDVAWSPDGSRIAFVSEITGNLEINLMNVNGTNVQRLTNIDAGHITLCWSPDGTKIIFSTHNFDGNSGGFYVLRLDDNEIQKIANNDFWSPSPSWSLIP